MASATAILMATYNGERYLRGQLDSLYGQTDKDWDLYVSDDCSKDGTMFILREYAASHSNMHICQNERSKGPMANFMDMLSSVEAEYYLFCDQDDVWLSEKVAKARAALLEAEARYGAHMPIVMCTDLRVVDANLKELHSSMWKMSDIRPHLLVKEVYLAGHNLATGCTMMFNRAAKNASLPYDEQAGQMHDAWVTMSAVHHGGQVIPMTDADILYRQHGNNAIGAVDNSKNYWSYRIRNLRLIWQRNVEQYHFASRFRYGSVVKYIWYKIMYKFNR